jgi:hypothetical protein
MSVRYIAHAASAAVVLLALTISLAVANADSSVSAGARPTAKQVQPSASACTIVERPKHTIRKCRCSSNTFSNVASVDLAEMLRLLTRASSCQAPAPALTRR